ncbi:hypothetical protein BGX26_012963 [Mortierella sp. AD094]|nr:hypothetical protein BGX26_012963 [Mortierella sp. AD094]
MIDASPSRDGKQFIIGGNRDNLGALSYIYDVASAKWITTPDLPGMAGTMSTYKRGNVGMTLDPSTGLIYIYGGFQYLSFSKEISVLDSSNPDPTKMSWTLSMNQTVIPALYQPYVLYLPTLKKVIVFAGCNVYNVSLGLVGSCATLNTAYLISDGFNAKALSIQNQDLSTGPAPRYQSCRVVLNDGNVFIQGGRDPNTFFGDAWLLNVSNWTWTQIPIDGPSADMTRAGHTCQMGPNGQVVLVGGFAIIGNASLYVTPYMAVIDTNTWTWTTSYKGAPINSIWANVPLAAGDDSNGSGLSAGAKGGIGAGVAIGVLGIALGFFLWRRKKLSSRNNHITGSNLNETPSIVEMAQGASNHGNSNNTINNVHHLVTIDSTKTSPIGSGARTATAASHIEHVSEGQQATQDNGRSGSLLVSEPMTTATLKNLPVHSGSLATGTLGSPLMNTSEKPGSFANSPVLSNSSGPMDDTVLAAAVFQAEDKSSRISPSLFNLEQTRSPSPIAVSTVRTPESFMPGVKYTEPPLSSLSPSPPPKPTSDPGTPPRTIHTPVVNTLMTAESAARPTPGPQSVPEQEAKIERSSPGVKTHVVTPRDLDPDGFYPPLSPTRPHGTHSILVGTPASTVPSKASSFSAITSSLKFTPSSEAGSFTAATGYFGPVTGAGGGQKQGHDLDHSDISQPIPYRDPQMLKDLVDIAKLIESQTLAEFKNPHAVVEKGLLSTQEKKD